jgi:protein-L-isoaspartate(D-aspartate) O-methyltransferase
MIAMLQSKGIKQADVLRAMMEVPRHFFVDSMLARRAYEMKALSLPVGDWREPPQTISHPLTVAIQTGLLQVKITDKIIEIGTGSGYQTAVLCAMGVQQMFSVERQHALHVFAKNVLDKMGYYPTLVFGDGFAGLPQYAPFDKIIVTCGADSIPPNLQAQLAVGGRMVIPVKATDGHHLIVVERDSHTAFRINDCGRCRDFVPMLKETTY